jgi:hypothetical protein
VARWRTAAFAAGLAATAGTFAWMESAGHGDIIGLELAFTRDRAAAVLEAWARHPGLRDAATYVGRDYAFLAAYWVPMALGARWAAARYAARGHDRAARAGRWTTWLPLVAAGLDAVEDAFLLRMVHAAQGGRPLAATDAALGSAAATVKWLLVLAVLGYAGGALVVPRRQPALTTAS